MSELKGALQRSLTLPESTEKHAKIQALTNLISTVIEACPTPGQAPNQVSQSLGIFSAFHVTCFKHVYDAIGECLTYFVSKCCCEMMSYLTGTECFYMHGAFILFHIKLIRTVICIDN